MGLLTTGNYQVDIFNYPFSNYSAVDSEDKYDLLYFEDCDYISSTIIGIKVHHADGLIKSALIGATGGGTGIHQTSFIVESDRIVICCSDTIFCLSIPDLFLVWKTKADEATCFEIFSYKTDYIIHGELEITRLSNDGHVIWQRGGADIFTTLNPTENDFTINDEYILTTDWENRKYKFDFQGNVLK
jgi:hypothetical protein